MPPPPNKNAFRNGRTTIHPRTGLTNLLELNPLYTTYAGARCRQYRTLFRTILFKLGLLSWKSIWQTTRAVNCRTNTLSKQHTTRKIYTLLPKFLNTMKFEIIRRNETTLFNFNLIIHSRLDYSIYKTCVGYLVHHQLCTEFRRLLELKKLFILCGKAYSK